MHFSAATAMVADVQALISETAAVSTRTQDAHFNYSGFGGMHFTMARRGGRDEIDSLLKRLNRQTGESCLDQPPDQSSAALGRRLGTSFVSIQDDDTAVGDEILESLLSKQVNPAVPHAYFNVISSSGEVSLETLSQWICRCDLMIFEQESDTFETLSAIIHAYAVIAHKQVVRTTLVEEGIAELFHKLKVPGSRLCLVRNFVETSGRDFGSARLLLSPIMAASIMSASSSTQELSLFLDLIWQKCRSFSRANQSIDGIVHFISWMQTSLRFFLWRTSGDKQRLAIASEIAYRWLQQLTDVLGHLITKDVTEELGNSISAIVQGILRDILPHFFSISYRIELTSILDRLVEILDSPKIDSTVEPAIIFKLITLALSTPLPDDASGIAVLISKCQVAASAWDLIRPMLQLLECVNRSNGTPPNLFKQVSRMKALSQTVGLDGECATNLIQLFEKHSENTDRIIRVITPTASEGLVLSPLKQNAALLMAMSLLYSSSSGIKAASEEFLRLILQQFPRLGITLLPVLVESVHSSCHKDGRELLRWLEYLCDFLVLEPQCAQGVWNIVGVKLMQDETTVLRSSVIRLYPQMCRRNKKLYRRVVDSLGVAATSSEPEVRLAVAATIAELAEEDRIRDVSDVIGWIQTFLADENSSVVYYAIMSLHHLIVAEELDYNLVIKVLNKRLCQVTDLTEILGLPDVGLEALVLLLGDGESDGTESIIDSDNETSQALEAPALSPQVSASIQLLLDLGLSPALAFEGTTTTYSKEAKGRIRHNLYKSLSNYSLYALGVDEDAVRAALSISETTGDSSSKASTPNRYIVLTNLILGGVQDVSTASNNSGGDNNSEDPDAAADLARKLISYEEEVLGHTLWQKGGKVVSESKGKSKKVRSQKSALTALPSPSLVTKYHNDSPGTVSAIASLLCFDCGQLAGGQKRQLNEVTTELFELANDISNDSSDGVSLALMVQAWLHAMGKVWSMLEQTGDSNNREVLTNLIRDVQEWSEMLGAPDHAYLAMASVSLFLPDQLTDLFETINSVVEDANDHQSFENKDIAHICVGLLGARAAFSRSMGHVTTKVHLLTKAMQGLGGRGTGGASYGLALITQALPGAATTPGASTLSDTETAKKLISVITGTLVDSLLSTIEPSRSVFLDLVACIKSGKASPNLKDAVETVEDSSLVVSDSSRQKVKSICVAMAVALPALRVVDPDLLLASYRLLRALPWCGVGKGFALPPVVSACQSLELLSEEDIQQVIRDCQDILDHVTEGNGSNAIGDAFYCISSVTRLNGGIKDPTSFSLLVESAGRFGVGDSLSVLVGAVSLLGSIPCLGAGPHAFCDPARLYPTTQEGSVADITKAMVDLLHNSNGVREREASITAIALASSMKSPSTHHIDFSSDQGKSSKRSKAAMVATMLKAQSGTCLSGVLDLVQQSTLSPEGHSVLVLPRLLRTLRSLSLPGLFVKALLEPLINSGFDSDEVKAAVIELLMSQVVGRRKAAYDAREFVNMVLRISKVSSRDFLDLVGVSGASIYISAFPNVIQKLPTDSVQPALGDVWRLCDTDSSLMLATAFLKQLCEVLRSTNSTSEKRKVHMSPKTMSFLRKFVIDTAFTSVSDKIVGNGRQAEDNQYLLLEAMSKCLGALQLEELDTLGFFKTGNAEVKVDILRVTCTMLLTRSGYFEESGRNSNEVTKAVAWIARRLTSTIEQRHVDPLRRVAFEIAFTTKEVTAASRHDIVLLLLDALVLVEEPNRLLGVHFLAMLLAIWVKDDGYDADLSLAFLCISSRQSLECYYMLPEEILASISEMLLCDLPQKFGHFCRKERGTATIINGVRRLFKPWSEDGADARHVQCLKKMIVCSGSANHGDHQDSSVAIAMLV